MKRMRITPTRFFSTDPRPAKKNAQRKYAAAMPTITPLVRWASLTGSMGITSNSARVMSAATPNTATPSTFQSRCELAPR